jgi:two-component system chemotaxis sensor kinase CheA
MGFIERMEKNIAKLEKRIQKEEMGIARLAEKSESKKITKADFTLKKRVIEKQHQEEKAEEKEKKKEEKEKKKEGKVREKENKSSEEK